MACECPSQHRKIDIDNHSLQALAELIKPDVVHVLRDGRIIATGGFEIVDKIENEGYDSINE